jgi:UDP-N-acetylglucosamine enolpyruvyl transferase
VDFFAAFGAAAFVGLLPAALAAADTLAGTDFDAAALRAGALLAAVLVGVFATGETLLMN